MWRLRRPNTNNVGNPPLFGRQGSETKFIRPEPVVKKPSHRARVMVETKILLEDTGTLSYSAQLAKQTAKQFLFPTSCSKEGKCY